MVKRIGIVATLLLLAGAAAGGTGPSFVNFESPHVNPLDMTPDGTKLLVVNTADNRLEIFTVNGTELVRRASVPVGLDPVSVRARDNDEAWVANHISDTVSVVDLNTLNVRATIATGDEPADIVFAGEPLRAFVSVSQLNQVNVYDPEDLSAPPVILTIEGEDPRALSTDGTTVYAAIFESGNRTTMVDHVVVSSDANPYPGNPNPPPNAGDGPLEFDPPFNEDLPNPLPSGVIVRRDEAGVWRDSQDADWSAGVTWDLHDHDVAVIDASTLDVTYVTGLMNLDMNLAVGPAGDVVVIGTDAINEVRFEPNLNGIFVRVIAASFTPPATTPSAVVDINPHLDYSTPTVPQETRDQSVGDPRGIDWSAAGDRVYVAGMGSNNLVVLDAALSRVGLIEVGEGPTAVKVNDAEGVAYVLNHFEGSVSIVDTTAQSELARVEYHDPTPAVIREGRPFLYDTHLTSGLGQVSCGSCHINGRMDQIAWDLGVPDGDLVPFFDQTQCNFGFGGCEPWHPVKGPLMTQTLMGIIGLERFHWRGDRVNLAAFNVAFPDLLGDDTMLMPQEMSKFQAFLATLTLPPNPYRQIQGPVAEQPLFNGGVPVLGEFLFSNVAFDSGVTCAGCHTLPSGTDGRFSSGFLVGEPLSLKNPQLRNLYEKTGFDKDSLSSNRGFGFTHDGSFESMFEFLQKSQFQFAAGEQGDFDRLSLEAYLFSFATDTHPGIGVQATIDTAAGPGGAALRDTMISIAQANDDVAMVVKGRQAGEQRGYVYDEGSGLFRSDRVGELLTLAELDAASGAESEMTYTLVPAGTEQRIGIDRDEDGYYDRNELDSCSHPGDPAIVPGAVHPACCQTVCDQDPACCENGWDELCEAAALKLCGAPCPEDVNGDLFVDVQDLVTLVLDWGPCPGPPDLCPNEITGDGVIDVEDLVAIILAWGPCGPGK